MDDDADLGLDSYNDLSDEEKIEYLENIVGRTEYIISQLEKMLDDTPSRSKITIQLGSGNDEYTFTGKELQGFRKGVYFCCKIIAPPDPDDSREITVGITTSSEDSPSESETPDKQSELFAVQEGNDTIH